MNWADRSGNVTEGDNSQDKLLKAMYTTVVGRAALSLLVKPVVSRACGRFLDTGISTLIVKPFCNANNIDLSEYEKRQFSSFNDFFTRKIKADKRPFDIEQDALVSPCDSRLTVYKIDEEARFNVKNTKYTVKQLLRDGRLAKEFEGGYICIFRLSVDDYHRYAYIDDGVQSSERFIQGALHTVNPIANDYYPIYKENSREYCLIKTVNFGEMIAMEVGALLVGKIVNYDEKCIVKRGQEKGRFEYGGSTIILMFKKDAVEIDEDIIKNTKNDCETRVRMGEKVGNKRA